MDTGQKATYFMAKLAWLSCVITAIAAAAIASDNGVQFNVEKYCNYVDNQEYYKNCVFKAAKYKISDGRDPAVLSYLCCLGFWCNPKNIYVSYADISYIKEMTQGINYQFMTNVAKHLKMCGKGFYQLLPEDERYLCQHYYSSVPACHHSEAADEAQCLNKKFKRLSSDDFHYWLNNGQTPEACTPNK